MQLIQTCNSSTKGENGTIEAYLDAAQSWAEDGEVGKVQRLPEGNPWRMFAILFYCGKICEQTARTRFTKGHLWDCRMRNFRSAGYTTGTHQDRIGILQFRFNERRGKCVSTACLGRNAPERGRTTRACDRILFAQVVLLGS